MPRIRAAEAHARGWDFSFERMPSVAEALESVQKATRRLRSAARTSSSLIMKMMPYEFAVSATTRSITASRGSMPISFPIVSSVFPSYFLSAGFRTAESITPAAPPEPTHWFDQASLSSAISRFTRARIAGSARRATSFSFPPSRTHGGRQASRPFEPAVHGYMFAATSSPSARAASSRARTRGIRPQFRFEAVFRCQTFAGIRASRAIRKTSSSEASIWFPSDRWWVK